MPTSRQRKRFERARHELVRLSHRGLKWVAFVRSAAEALQRAVPFDGACWHIVDPASLLITSHYTNLSGEGFRFICRNEYLQDDFLKFASLARSSLPAGILSQATGGVPEKSARYREIYRPRGWGAEMRASFDAADVSWGSVMLLRQAGLPDFTAAEAGFLASLSRHLAHGLRLALLKQEARGPEQASESGWVVLDRENELEAASKGVERLLGELAGRDHLGPDPLPAAVLTVAALTRRTGGEARSPARLRLRAPSGRWLVLHGSLLADPPDGRVRVALEPASRFEIASVIVQAHGLTPREREVAAAMLRGLTNPQIAAELRISRDTAHDHVASIYEKTGAHGRQDLVGRIFREHFEPRVISGAAVGPRGWFAEGA